MKFVLVGHFWFDVIHPADGGEKEQPGGIYNAAAMLSTLVGKNDVILPVCGVSREDVVDVTGLFEKLPGVSTEGIYKIDTPSNRVHILTGAKGDAFTCSADIAPPIPFERLRKHVACDGMLINMVSGFDIALETMDQIRILAREEKTVIHFDYHNLTMGLNERHERFRRPLDTWRRWAFMVDTVQMNEEEIAGLDGSTSDEATTVGHMLTLGVKGVIVTRGARGVTAFVDAQKHVTRVDVDAVSHNGAGSIGNGDRFGAAFLHGMLTTGNIAEAARTAVSGISQILNHN